VLELVPAVLTGGVRGIGLQCVQRSAPIR